MLIGHHPHPAPAATEPQYKPGTRTHRETSHLENSR